MAEKQAPQAGGDSGIAHLRASHPWAGVLTDGRGKSVRNSPQPPSVSPKSGTGPSARASDERKGFI
jgi:hypothetical protein